jgi:DNA-binding MarR family transcriptional regulator
MATDDAVRELLLLMPRIIGRIKRIPPPEQLREAELAPRHLSLLSLLLLDGPQAVSELAERLEVAPTTVSLIVGELSRKGVVARREDEQDRRKRIIDIDPDAREAIEQWLQPGATAWRRALAPLDPEQQRMVVDTLNAYEAAVAEDRKQDAQGD